MRIRKLLVSALVASSLFVVSNAFAGPSTDVVRAKQTELFKVIQQQRTPARQAKLRTLFDEMLAYDVIARDSMRDYWADLSADDRVRFSALLTDIVRNNYRRNLKKMLDYNITYTGEETEGSRIWVNTRADHKTDARNAPFEVNFLVEELEGRWRVVDLAPEAASLTRTYRAQFKRIMKKKGFDELMTKLEKKRKKQEEELD